MGWLSKDGQHEGYLAAALVDGQVTATSNDSGPVVGIYDDAGKYTGATEQHGDDEVVAWRLCCDCAPTAVGASGAIWVGDTWQRVPTPVLEDVDQGRIYVAVGEPASDVAHRPDVAEVTRALAQRAPLPHRRPEHDPISTRKHRR